MDKVIKESIGSTFLFFFFVCFSYYLVTLVLIGNSGPYYFGKYFGEALAVFACAVAVGACVLFCVVSLSDWKKVYKNHAEKGYNDNV
jgi:hypothetical protein